MKNFLLFGFLMLSFIGLIAQDSTAFQNFHGNGNIAARRFVSVPTPQGSDLRVTGDWTLETWVYVPDTLNTSIQTYLIESYGFGNTGGFVLRLQGSRVMAYQIAGPSSASNIVGNASVTLGAWNHVAATMNTSLNRLSVYLNGQPDAFVNSTIASNMQNDQINIGARGDDRNITQNLVIFDEVRIWNVARTDAEIQADMNNCLTGNENGLILYYDFETIQGASVLDRSTSGNDGTFENHDTISLVDGVFYCSTVVGIQDAKATSISLFPNPAQDWVKLQGFESKDFKQAEIYTCQGQLVKTEKRLQFSVSDLAVGVYILKIQTESGHFVERLIKE